MGGLFGGNKGGKSVSTIPKEFLPYARDALTTAQQNIHDPLFNIRGYQSELGINPGYEISPAQRRAKSATASMLPDVSALFNKSFKQQKGTIKGEYLDPTQVSGWDALTRKLKAQGQETFQGLLDTARQGAAMGDAFRSSAREGQEFNAARGVARDIGLEMARGGMDTYNRERAMQEQASQTGRTMLPDVANQLFGQGSTIADAQIKDLATRMQAAQGTQGMRDVGIQQIISALGALGGVREGGGGGGGLPGMNLIAGLLS